MARPTSVEIVRHISEDELDIMLRAARKDIDSYARSKKLYERLLFVRMRYSGRSAEEAAAAVGFLRATGYNTQDLWDAKGPEHLLPVPNPGRPSMITQDQKDLLGELLTVNPIGNERCTPLHSGRVRHQLLNETGACDSCKCHRVA